MIALHMVTATLAFGATQPKPAPSPPPAPPILSNTPTKTEPTPVSFWTVAGPIASGVALLMSVALGVFVYRVQRHGAEAQARAAAAQTRAAEAQTRATETQAELLRFQTTAQDEQWYQSFRELYTLFWRDATMAKVSGSPATPPTQT